MTSPRIAWTQGPAARLAAEPASARDWDRLNASALDLPFLGADAMVAAIAAFGSGREQLFVGRADGRVVAMFILVPQGKLRWLTFQPSQIPLGAWVAEPAFGLVDLVDSLLRGPLGWCLALSITQIDPLIAPPAADTSRVEHSPYIETGFIDVQGSFADYWAARGKNLRQNLRKQRNKLAAEGTQTALRMLTAPDEMAPALARYGALESSGWKAGQGTAIHADNAQGRFYTALFTQAAQRGEALVYEYLFDDRTVAMDLCLIRGGRLIVLKTTYDESIKLFSPASLLREEELQHAFGEGAIRRIEYYGRLMEWHTKLTDQKRSLHHLTAFRWSVVKRVAERRRAAQTSPAEAQAPVPEAA